LPAFQGIHDHTLDSKNRLTVPAKARPELAAGMTLTKGFERCLQLWPAAEYERITRDALAGLNPFGPEARDLKRHLYGNTITTELDSAGRIMLPGPFLQYAGITKDVVVVGSGDCLELWDRESWHAYDTDLISRAADHIAGIGHPA
jgi:MraZ protein